MKAWKFHAAHQPLELKELEDPTPSKGQVLIEVKAAGLCHSDVGFMDGTLTDSLSFRPIVLGHEVAGVVTELGEGVTDFAIGERVAVFAGGNGKPGPENNSIGIGRNGGFAQKVLAWESELIRIPENVSFDQAATATDAGMTTHQAVVAVGRVTAGTKVRIIGLGGLGLTAARIAVITGAEVYAAEINEAVYAAGTTAGVKKSSRVQQNWRHLSLMSSSTSQDLERQLLALLKPSRLVAALFRSVWVQAK